MWLPLHRMPSFANKKRKLSGSPSRFTGFLKEPVTDKLDCENVVLNGMEIGHAAMQGYRVHMEDKHIIEPFPELSDHVLVAIMDGHGGTGAAEYTSTMLRSAIEDCDAWGEYLGFAAAERKDQAELLGTALVQAYLAVDTELRDIDWVSSSGCTAVCCIVTPSHIVCASVGDSRAVVGTKSATVSLTEDHKPSNAEERLRIEAAGGFVHGDRVKGELAMSRALGDFIYKQECPGSTDRQHMVIAYPDISIHVRNAEQDEVLLLACDGVWDVISNEESVGYVASLMAPGTPEDESDSEEEGGGKGGAQSHDIVLNAQEAAESLLDLALMQGSTDNISAVVVRLTH